MDLEQFVYLDRDCETFIQAITQVMGIADSVSRLDPWGLGEHTVSDSGKKLTSGEAIVQRFKSKSRGASDQSDNSVYAIMQAHLEAVKDIQETYRRICKQITDHDADQAAKYAQLVKTLPRQPAVSVPQYVSPCYVG
ncbi:hypothetical protein [Nocardia alni]|uniref:hypothetical protein n=1 Tax=Nocardia alni TaxID=2815723 RepID=UPI001C224D74|nr:hypothetical protein [Nocardia alni]